MKVLLVLLLCFMTVNSNAALIVRVKDARTNSVKQIDQDSMYFIRQGQNLVIKGFQTYESDAIVLTPAIAKASAYPSLQSLENMIKKTMDFQGKEFTLECYIEQGTQAIHYCKMLDALATY